MDIDNNYQSNNMKILILKIQHEISSITQISRNIYSHTHVPMIDAYENVLKWIRESNTKKVSDNITHLKD